MISSTSNQILLKQVVNHRREAILDLCAVKKIEININRVRNNFVEYMKTMQLKAGLEAKPTKSKAPMVST